MGAFKLLVVSSEGQVQGRTEEEMKRLIKKIGKVGEGHLVATMFLLLQT